MRATISPLATKQIAAVGAAVHNVDPTDWQDCGYVNKQSAQQSETSSQDWSGLFFDTNNDLPGKLMTRARKRYGDSPDAEAAYNYALDAISANQFASLSERYAGTGSAAGFLSISFLHLMEEYARHKYPRVRPPAWLKRLGDLWVRTWQMLCLQRQNPETIVDALGQNTPPLRQEVREATVQIKARVPNCGLSIAEQTTLDEDGPAQPAPTDSAPDEAGKHEVAMVLLQVIAAVMGGNAESIGPQQLAALATLGNAVELSDQERLLLQLIYEQGHKIASAARALDLERKQASRLHAAVLARLRKALEPLGLTRT